MTILTSFAHGQTHGQPAAPHDPASPLTASLSPGGTITVASGQPFSISVTGGDVDGYEIDWPITTYVNLGNSGDVQIDVSLVPGKDYLGNSLPLPGHVLSGAQTAIDDANRTINFLFEADTVDQKKLCMQVFTVSDNQPLIGSNPNPCYDPDVKAVSQLVVLLPPPPSK